MKYIDEYRDSTIAEKLGKAIQDSVSQPWTIMEVCGGQTHAILQYGIEDLLPDSINLVHGPGCPVCVTPVSCIDKAIEIAQMPSTIFCSYGDMLRVPGSKSDLLELKAKGKDVRIVYSPLDALDLAQKFPDKQIVFFAVGFETTAPANAMAVYQARQKGMSNFFILCSHVTVPPVCESILQSEDNNVDAFIGPGHVCTVMGLEEYEKLSSKYKVPIVVAGFEPIDLLEGILISVKQLESGQYSVVNQYARAVAKDGNKEAQAILAEVFQPADRAWRGLGSIGGSGYKLKDKYKNFDAEYQFGVQAIDTEECKQCISGQILKGLKKPTECDQFATVCTPENPLGTTMVSTEGTCANYYKFKRLERRL